MLKDCLSTKTEEEITKENIDYVDKIKNISQYSTKKYVNKKYFSQI